MKVFNRIVKFVGELQKRGTTSVTVVEVDADNNIILAKGTTVPTDGDAGYAKGCLFIDTDATGGMIVFVNQGTTSACDFNALTALVPSNYAATATADGLTTGLIPVGTRFVTATSGNAAHALTLPAISSSTIGQRIDIVVGSNGYELLTPAASNNTINTVDSDGTNQLDVAANTLLMCIQTSATNWSCIQVAATTITVVAPDND